MLIDENDCNQQISFKTKVWTSFLKTLQLFWSSFRQWFNSDLVSDFVLVLDLDLLVFVSPRSHSRHRFRTLRSLSDCSVTRWLNFVTIKYSDRLKETFIYIVNWMSRVFSKSLHIYAFSSLSHPKTAFRSNLLLSC
jgi:hypothetical protein